MFSPEIEEVVKHRSRALNIVWLALTFSVPIYAVVAYVVVSGQAAPVQSTDDILRIVFAALAVIHALMAQGLWFFLMNNASSQAANVGSQPAKTEVEKVLGKYFVAVLVVLAINESIAIFGMIDAILSGLLDRILIFVGAALVLNFLRKPDAARFLNKVTSRTM
ncbi:MAG: hypothetical protein KDD66_08560 [Bdellovibrionales bacterium]|nr:hypothetical protein [Bdellovibrionales bacterium]